MPVGEAAQPIWTRTFALLSLAQFLSYGHFGMLTPLIPLFVTSLGYDELTVGLVLAGFSITSFGIRPLIGYWTDTWSVRGILGMGGLLLALPTAALAVPQIWVVAAVNAVRGVGWSAFNTGGNTLLAHVAPPARRGEAASYVGLFQSLALSITPPFALWLLEVGGGPDGGYPAVFLVAALAGLMVGALALLLPAGIGIESHSTSIRASSDGGVLARFFDPGVMLASMLLLCMMLASPAVTTFVPLYARTLGVPVASTGWFYLASGLTSLATRAVVGGASDRWGRGPAMAGGLSFALLGTAMLWGASDLGSLVLGGVAFSIGQTLHQPATMALAIDQSNPRRRGAAMASYSLWFQVATGLGSALSGAIASAAGYKAMYAVALLPLIAGLVLVAAKRGALK